MPLLEIKNLHVEIDGKKILNGLDLTVNAGEVHAIMGPNGSGKSTLAYVLAGKADYEITEGEVLFNGDNALEMDPDERAANGVFLAFQYPITSPRKGSDRRTTRASPDAPTRTGAHAGSAAAGADSARARSTRADTPRA